MVAITVILAAVIAAFVFGLAGTTGSSKNVGLTVAKDGIEDFRITVQGGTDLPSLTGLSYTTNTSAPVAIANTDDLSVGQSVTITGYNETDDATNSGVRLVVTGTFNDGSTQVLFDRQY